jgi:hypothetical protein
LPLPGKFPEHIGKQNFMDIPRLYCERKGGKMSVYKDTTQRTWYASFRYVDWTGKKKQKMKRGFRTKKEAQQYEAEFKRKAVADMDMRLENFVEV